MSDGVLKYAELFEQMAKESKSSLEAVIAVLRINEKRIQAEQAERRSSPEERDVIYNADVEKMFNGHVPDSLDDMNAEDIAKRLGVRPNQGNSACITRRVKQLLLTDKSKSTAKSKSA